MRLSAQEAKPGVYLITNLVNGKKYIGSSINVRKRVTYHASGHGSTVLKAAMEKYGAANFSVKFLQAASRDRLPRVEAKWIRRLKPEYNITLLTESGGHIVSAATGAKISAAKIGHRHTEAARQKLRDDWASRDHSERKAKMAASNVGRLVSDETRKKRSIAMKGVVIPPAQRALMLANAAIAMGKRKLPPDELAMRRKASWDKRNKMAAAILRAATAARQTAMHAKQVKEINAVLAAKGAAKLIDFVDAIGVSEATMQVRLKRLISSGHIVATGNTKGRRFSLADKEYRL